MGKFVEKFNFITNIIILLILVFGTIGYSVGFHFPYEILPGQFANGNYSFNGSLSIGSTTANGEPFWVDSGTTDTNFIVDNNISLTRIGAVNDLNNAWKTLNIEDLMYINGSSGKVGIGTSSPQDELHISGTQASQGDVGISITNLAPGSTGSPNYISLKFRGYGNEMRAEIKATDIRANSLLSSLIFSVHDGSQLVERMNIDYLGNVKINGLSGSGNKYVCVDNTGQLYTGLSC